MFPSMPEKPIAAQKGALTPEAFASLLLWASPDQDKAAQTYLDLRSTLVKYFVRKGCAHAEDLADGTLDRVASIVHKEPGKYPNALALCCGVARRVWLEYLREAAPVSLDEDNWATPVHDASDFTEQEMRCLESCLTRLAANDRELITQYHQFQGSRKIETRKDLAQLNGGLNKLRIKVYRIRIRLHDCVSSCTQRTEFN
jgi:DNA-directed RNA polymerase specialized sigma24 family protein